MKANAYALQTITARALQGSTPVPFDPAPDMLQVQQLQAEADNSLKQAKSQAAALSLEKERLHAQLQHQQQAATGAPVEVPVQNTPQVNSNSELCLDP